MNTFDFDTRAQFDKALKIVKEIGVDYEADPDELTIITDQLSLKEHARICTAYS